MLISYCGFLLLTIVYYTNDAFTYIKTATTLV